ncbi:MAG: hypothetical protein Q4A00_01975, partial [Flavobacteriaceae bacterium]|nr:hypothetical protein [Flavobacteriaceae bacterium]
FFTPRIQCRFLRLEIKGGQMKTLFAKALMTYGTQAVKKRGSDKVFICSFVFIQKNQKIKAVDS